MRLEWLLGAEEDDEGREVLEEKQDALEVQANAVQEKLDALQESLESPDPEQLAVADAVVFIGHDGKVKVERGLIRRETTATAAVTTVESHTVENSCSFSLVWVICHASTWIAYWLA